MIGGTIVYNKLMSQHVKIYLHDVIFLRMYQTQVTTYSTTIVWVKVPIVRHAGVARSTSHQRRTQTLASLRITSFPASRTRTCCKFNDKWHLLLLDSSTKLKNEMLSHCMVCVSYGGPLSLIEFDGQKCYASFFATIIKCISLIRTCQVGQSC